MDLEVYNKDISPEIAPQKLEQKQKKDVARLGDSGAGNTATQTAKKYLGVKYVWGGESMSKGGLDCSGLVVRTYRDMGINMERFSSSTLAANPKKYGFVEIPVKQAQPGDVMWNKGHVALMYDGKNVIEASQSKGKTVIQTAWNRHKNFTRAYRYVGG